jgi:DNA-binding MarR family transcriptional regulator
VHPAAARDGVRPCLLDGTLLQLRTHRLASIRGEVATRRVRLFTEMTETVQRRGTPLRPSGHDRRSRAQLPIRRRPRLCVERTRREGDRVFDFSQNRNGAERSCASTDTSSSTLPPARARLLRSCVTVKRLPSTCANAVAGDGGSGGSASHSRPRVVDPPRRSVETRHHVLGQHDHVGRTARSDQAVEDVREAVHAPHVGGRAAPVDVPGDAQLRCQRPRSNLVDFSPNIAQVQFALDSTELDRGQLHELLQLLALVSRRLRGGRDVPEALRDAFHEGALGPRHMPVLFSLARRPAASVGELAARFGLAPATVSLLVNDLSRAGLVERREDDQDRRRTHVSVSEHHRRLLLRLADERIGLVRRTLSRLTPEARAHFAEGLRILAEESEAIDVDGPAAERRHTGVRR